jgi:hypothetical protein
LVAIWKAGVITDSLVLKREQEVSALLELGV